MSSQKLILSKTHDYCAKDEPVLTVVLIHGIASDSTTFDGILKYLEGQKTLEKVRFVTFDLLGSGKSMKGDDLNYDYEDQLSALHNSIEALKINTPLVLVGHSLGTFIVTRYASVYKNAVLRLILISPPVFTVEDLDNPAFAIAMRAFKDIIGAKNPAILNEKSFTNSMEKIVLSRDNYQTLAELEVPTDLIYGDEDQLIASYNLPKLIKDNRRVTANKVHGRHGVTNDKFAKTTAILEELLNAQDL